MTKVFQVSYTDRMRALEARMIELASDDDLYSALLDGGRLTPSLRRALVLRGMTEVIEDIERGRKR